MRSPADPLPSEIGENYLTIKNQQFKAYENDPKVKQQMKKYIFKKIHEHRVRNVSLWCLNQDHTLSLSSSETIPDRGSQEYRALSPWTKNTGSL